VQNKSPELLQEEDDKTYAVCLERTLQISRSCWLVEWLTSSCNVSEETRETLVMVDQLQDVAHSQTLSVNTIPQLDGLRCPNIDVNVFPTLTACCDLDLQNLIMSSVELVNIPSKFVSSRLLKPFTRYRGNKICPEVCTNERGGRTAPKHNAFADIVAWLRHKNQHYQLLILSVYQSSLLNVSCI